MSVICWVACNRASFVIACTIRGCIRSNEVGSVSSTRMTCQPYCVCTGAVGVPGVAAFTASSNACTYWPAV